MQLNSIKTLAAAGWVVLVCLAAIAGDPSFLSNWTLLVGVAVVPPMIMMWRWNEPPQTVSERIRGARR